MNAPDDIPIGGKGAYDIPGDDIPLKGGSYQVPESEAKEGEVPLLARGAYKLPDEEAPEEQEKEETGPLEKRIDSKTWKTRCKAYEELTTILKSNPNGPYSDFSSGLVKYISDSNPGAQEKALDLLKVYIENQPDMTLSSCEGLVKVLVEKGMASAKPTIKNESTNIIQDLFSIHKDNFEAFNSGLISCLNNKNIKVQQAAMLAVNTIMCAFGAKKLSFKPFVGIIEKYAAASNPQVRGEALNFYKECFRWVRDLIKPNVEKLKKPQQDELEKAFAEITEVPVPTKWLKCEEAQAKKMLESGASAAKPIDIYEMADAKDIFNKYGEKWCNAVLAMEKWTEKKAALEELNKEADYPKLAEKSALELVTLAKRLINDSNVNVMLQTMKLVGLLAKGQRKYFDNYAKQFLPVILQKFKDKKTLVLLEAHSSLDNLMLSLSFEQCIEDFKEALDDKTPSVKTNTCQFLERLFERMPPNETKAQAKLIGTIMKKNTDDSTPDVRQASFKLLAVLLNKCPEVLNPIIKDLPAAKMKKIEEAGGSAANQNSAPSAPQPASKAPEEKKEKAKAENTKSSAPATQKKEPTKASSNAPAGKTGAQPAPKAQEKEEEDTNNAISAEEAETIVTGFLPSDMLGQLKDNAWKEKQAGLQKLSEWIAENSDLVNSQNEPILRFVRSTVKDWKENNFNVVKAAIEIFKNISENYTISRRAAASVLNTTALEKLADAKLLEVYNSCIVSLCSVLGPKFVVGLIIKNTAESNKPKVVSECCGIISKAISDYGAHTVNLKDVVDYAKAGLGQANPAIKKASQALTMIIYSYIGDKLTPLLTDIKESTMKVLQEEFSKTQLITNATFKTYKGQQEVKVVDARKALDEAMPRANIERLLTPALLKKLADPNWKIRKEGLDDFEGILDSSGMRIVPTGLETIIKPLVGRISDPNKSLVRQTLLLTGKLAAALGMESKNLARHFLPPIIGCLADKMNLLRADALTAVNKWAEEAGLDVVIAHSSAPLCIENPELRSELLAWLLDHKDKFKENDMKPYIQGTLACLQDKTAPIRTKAESLFAEIVDCLGFEAFRPYLKDIKPAVMNTLNAIFDKYKQKGLPELELSQSVSMPNPSRPSRVTKEAPQSNRSGSKESQKSRTGMPTRISSEADLKSSLKKPEVRSSKVSVLVEISIVIPGSKIKRLEQEAKCKWSVEDIRNDYQDKLKEQMRTATTPDLFALMYHNDFKKQVEGVGHFTSMVNSMTREFIEVLDIVFRWVWVRFQENANTQLIKGILEMLDMLVNALNREGYKLHDVEANLFLPIICEKSGQNNVQFKTMIRSIIHNSAKIYNPEKVFIFVLNGCNSKNTKSKVECLEELSELLKEFGIEICQGKDIKSIAKHASSSDNNVRTAAVQTMGEIYKLKGDQVWHIIGEVPDKVKDLFEQRFKAVMPKKLLKETSIISKIQTPKNKSLCASFDTSRSTTPNLPSDTREPKLSIDSYDSRDTKSSVYEVHGSKPQNIRGSKEPHRTLPPMHYSKPISPPAEEIKGPSSPSARITPTLEIQESLSITPEIPKIPEEKRMISLDIEPPNESLLYDPNKIPESILLEPLKFDESTSEMSKNIEILHNGDMSARVDALVNINDYVLNKLDSHKEELQKNANSLADALTAVIIITFDKPLAEIPLRFAKYFLNVVNKVCCTKIIMRELNETSLFALSEQILIRLLTEELEKLGEKSEGEAMLKILNGTMLRILEHCKPTRIIVVLIRLMTKYKITNSLQKMTGLIIRCLLKLTKIMNGLIHQIEVEKLLLVMHEYLSGSTHAGIEDVGSKTMKTILTEVVKLQGVSIWQSYEEVRKHPIPDVHIEKWIKALLSNTIYQSNNLINTPENKDLEIITPSESQQKVNEDMENKTKKKDVSDNATIGGCNLQDFKERLSMMKQRYGITTPATQSTDMTATLDNLRSKVMKKPEENTPSSLNDIKSRIQSFKNNK